MKISITINNKVYSVEDEFGFDSVSVDEAVEMFRGLLVCAGFHPCNVDNQFNLDYAWFTQEERDDNMQGHKKYNKSYNEGYTKGWDEALHNKKIEDFQANLYKQDDDDYVF